MDRLFSLGLVWEGLGRMGWLAGEGGVAAEPTTESNSDSALTSGGSNASTGVCGLGGLAIGEVCP